MENVALEYQSCPHCNKEIALRNFEIHEAQCVRQHKNNPPPPSSRLPIFSLFPPYSPPHPPPPCSQSPPSSLEQLPSFDYPSSSYQAPPSSFSNPPPFSGILPPSNSQIRQFPIFPPPSSSIEDTYLCSDCQTTFPISNYIQHESECEQRITICLLCGYSFPFSLMESHNEECIGSEHERRQREDISDINPPPFQSMMRNMIFGGNRSMFSRGMNFSGIMGEELDQITGLKREEIDRFPATEWKGEEEEICLKERSKCVICYSEFENGEKIRSLACWHRFHVECIDKWLEKSSNCPVCKENMKKVLKKGDGFG